MPYVTIPGYGSPFFPDEWSDEQIDAFISEVLSEARRSKLDSSTVKSLLTGLAAGPAQTVTSGYAGLSPYIPFADEKSARALAQRARERILGTDIEVPTDIPATLGGGLGSAASYIGIGSIPYVGMPLARLLGLGSGLEEAERRIRQGEYKRMGALTPEEKFGARTMGGVAGVLESLPAERVVSAFGRPALKLLAKRGSPALADLIRRAPWLKNMLKGAGEEFLQEGTSEAVQNVGEAFYNPERRSFRGIAENVPTAALVGGITGGLADLGYHGLAAAARRMRYPNTELDRMLAEEAKARAEARAGERAIPDLAAALGATSPTGVPEELFPKPEGMGAKVRTQPIEARRQAARRVYEQNPNADPAEVAQALQLPLNEVIDIRDELTPEPTPPPLPSVREQDEALLKRELKKVSPRYQGLLELLEPQKRTYTTAEGVEIEQSPQGLFWPAEGPVTTGAGEQLPGLPPLLQIFMRSVEAQESQVPDAERRLAYLETLDHESIHALRSMGVITDKEWRALVLSATRQGRINMARAQYTGVPGYDTDERFQEEGVAEMFKDLRRDLRANRGEVATRVWEKITRFIERMGNIFRGAGFRTGQAVI